MLLLFPTSDSMPTVPGLLGEKGRLPRPQSESQGLSYTLLSCSISCQLTDLDCLTTQC